MQHSGYVILIHPDFLWNTSLAKTIKKYEYFDYSVNEALHLSTKEEKKVINIIKSIQQEYHENIDKFSHCGILEGFFDTEENKTIEDQIDLLTLLIEKWDEEHNTFEESDPIELLQYLMAENNLKSKDLAAVLKVSKGLVSDILN